MCNETATSTTRELINPWTPTVRTSAIKLRWRRVQQIIWSALAHLIGSSTLLLLSACGGGGAGTDGGTQGEVKLPAPIASVSAYLPVNQAIGVTVGTPITISLSVANATSSDPSKVTWICAGKTIAFTATSSLSADGATLTVTMTPATNASSAGDVCAYQGAVTTVGPGGQVNTTVSGEYTNSASSGTTGLASTLAISAYLGTTYASDQLSLTAEVLAATSFMAGSGNSCTGSELTTLANLKEVHVQAFLNRAIANSQLAKSTSVIDKTAIVNLLNAYRTQDLAWGSSSSLGACGYSSLDWAATGYVSTVITYYSTALAQLSAL